jgi:hypothetical protein
VAGRAQAAATRAPGLNGHFIINDPPLWSDTLQAFIGQFGP